MPSWNIHTAHVERLFATEAPDALGIRDANAFAFGNLAPDIYVGYMVPNVSHKIKYADTHLADPQFIPLPDASQFYQLYVAQSEDDVVLGAWTHLLCDYYYNRRTVEYIATIGVRLGEQTRIRKQGDFDLFGRTLDISLVPEPTPALLDSCAAFPQYEIAREDALGAVEAVAAIVERNRAEHVEGTPNYSLLPPEFFQNTFAEVDAVLREALHTRAAGNDPSYLGRPEDYNSDPSEVLPADRLRRAKRRSAKGGARGTS